MEYPIISLCFFEIVVYYTKVGLSVINYNDDFVYSCGVRQSFQPTHPLRDATFVSFCKILIPAYFNPRIPCGMRRAVLYTMPQRARNFNPRRPFEVRRVGYKYKASK